MTAALEPLQDHPDIASDIDGKTVRANSTFLGDVPRHLMVMGHPPNISRCLIRVIEAIEDRRADQIINLQQAALCALHETQRI